MGGVFSSIFGWITESAKVDPIKEMGPESDIPDSTSGLTARQVAAIRRTWDLVRTDLKGNGVQFFITLFRTHPELQTRFKNFAGMPFEMMESSPRLTAHGLTVMVAVTSYIDSLDDLNTVVEMLKATAANHKARGIKKRDFELLSPVLIKFVKDNVGGAWSEHAQLGWTQLMKVILTIIHGVYDEE